jgi:hypothetical protein
MNKAFMISKSTAVILLTSCSVLFSQALSTRDANAFVGFITGSYSTTVTGLSLMGADLVVGGIGVLAKDPTTYRVGIALGVAGIVLFPADSASSVRFSGIPLKQGRELIPDLSATELEAYNELIPSLNLIADQIDSELAAAKDPTAERSRALWQAYGAELEPTGFEVAQKLAAMALAGGR